MTAARPATRTTPLVVVTVVAALALLVGACSGSSSESTDDTTSGPTGTTAVPAERMSTGCGTPPAVTAAPAEPAGDIPLTIVVGDQTRAYRLAIPAGYDQDQPAPVVMNLHGSGGSAVTTDATTQMPTRAGERGFITITPDAVDGNWQLAGQGADDDFLMAVVDEVEAGYCVDLSRVHLAGMSLGAWKAAVTACTHPDRFASIALVTVEVYPPECPPTSVVAFHGTGDHVVPYGEGADEGVTVQGGNAGLPGVVVNMPKWASGAGCSEQKDVERIEPDVEHWTYQDCPDGRGVEFYKIEHGDHLWPGMPFDLPGLTHTIDATALALDWFEAHPQT